MPTINEDDKNFDCPCGSGLRYADCCEPYIEGRAEPATAEALMRARYTAYVVHAIDYIVRTCDPDVPGKIDVKGTKEWSEKSTWLGLKILSTEKGSPTDTTGVVEFEADYEEGHMKDKHHERSRFRKRDGKWVYVDGSVVPITVVRDHPKVGRNDPCPCGSGKKYKYCHGRAQ